MLAHDNCPPATREEPLPSSFYVGDQRIEPDHELFGFAYTNEAGRTRYFYCQGFEADSGTETRTPNPGNFNASKKKNITKMVRGYRDYLLADGYKKRYGISNVSIPIIAATGDPHKGESPEVHMRSIMKVVERECDPDTYGPDLIEHFIFKHVPLFTEGYPPPTGHMVTEDWYQVGGGVLNILDILKGEADGPARTSRADRGAIDTDTREGEGAGHAA